MIVKPSKKELDMEDVAHLFAEGEREDQLSDNDLADKFRTRSFHLMNTHPIAAAHLVLAAASIAPTCDAEQEVADQFSYVIVDFAQQLGVLHRRAVSRRACDARSAANGH
ncbi:hypothetical protein [Sphingomonas aerolata]|uniref:hypothetical protein n=1 Tax=Sphingomonas aerolata TaxID=185951 RepID=UPI0033562EE2